MTQDAKTEDQGEGKTLNKRHISIDRVRPARFWNHGVLQRTEVVLEVIYRALTE